MWLHGNWACYITHEPSSVILYLGKHNNKPRSNHSLNHKPRALYIYSSLTYQSLNLIP